MKFFFKIILILISSIIYSCNFSSDDNLPKVNPNTLCDLLIDLHFASTAKSIGLLNPIDTFPKGKVSDRILKQYKVSESDLQQSIKYYSNKPDSLSALYSRMIERISTKQAQMR